MDNVRIEQLLGNKKVIVGTKYNDLVLETLGKVYIKSGNNFKLLTELIETLNKSDSKNILIVSSITEMGSMKYPGDGYFVFSSLNKALYISYDNRYIKLIEIDEEEKPDYVKKSGDTMTGPLEIDTTSAPLIVASSELIKNLNSEQVGGYKAEDLAKIRKDEIIYGLWTFKNPGVSEDLWTFNKNIDIKGDIILKGSLGSPSFASGFGGYGWRFDADTNTLTVDYLVVRKAMNVYELVVNQITATNGSLWVSNSTTIEEVEQPLIVTVNQLNYFEQDESNSQVGWQGTDLQKERFKALFFEGNYYLITDDVIGDTLSTNGDTKGREDQSPQNIGIVKETTSLSTSSTINNTEKVFVNYKYFIKITDIDGLLNSPSFQGKSTFLSENSLKNLSNYIKFTYISKKVYNNTYIETFDKNCGFYAKVQNTKIKIKSYYKYYGLKRETIQSAINACVAYFNSTHNKSLNYTVPGFYIVTSEDYTYFKPGDVIRCQKFQDNNIKYYDAVVLSQIADKSIIIQKADSVFDQYTEVEYVDGEKVQYTTTYSEMAYNNGEKAYDVTTDSDIYLEGYETEEERLNSRLAEPAVEDDIVQMGNIYDPKRQNAIYITSTDDQSPFMDIIGDVNRPDYSVIYEVPVFKRESYVNTTVDNGYRGVRYNYYLLSPTTENSKIQNVVPIYIDEKLTYYGTTTPMDNSLIEQVNGQDHYEYTCTTKVRVGKLDGITNYMFKDRQPYGYGLYGENVFLTGEFYLNNGQSVVDFSKDYIDLQVKTINETINQIKVDQDGISLTVKNLNDGLLATGINIQNKTITITSDKLIIQSNSGAENIGSIINGIDSDISKAQNTANQAQNTANSALTAAGNSETNAKNQIAQKLGYGSYNDMVAQVSKNGSIIIQGGYLNASLIQAKAITADMMNADGIIANNVVLSGNITANSGKFGIFTISSGQDRVPNSIYSDTGNLRLVNDGAIFKYNGVITIGGGYSEYLSLPPWVSGVPMLYMKPNNYQSGVGMLLDGSNLMTWGANYNAMIACNNGNILSNGLVSSISYTRMVLSSSNTITRLNGLYCNTIRIIVNGGVENVGIALPTQNELMNALKQINTDQEYFGIYITLICNMTNYSRIAVHFAGSDRVSQSYRNDLPRFFDQNGNRQYNVYMDKGDCIVLFLNIDTTSTTSGGRYLYNAFLVSTNDSGIYWD